jgi:hypothetical protein
VDLPLVVTVGLEQNGPGGYARRMATYRVTINPLSGTGETIEAESYKIQGSFAEFFDAEGNVIASYKTNSFASIVKE